MTGGIGAARKTRRGGLEGSEPDLLTVKEFSRRLSISVWTARAWCYKGLVASVKLGARLQVPSTEVPRLIAAGLRPQLDHEGPRGRGSPRWRASCSGCSQITRSVDAAGGDAAIERLPSVDEGTN